MPTIFLGSVGSDLREHREAVFAAVTALEGFEVRRIEDFGSSTEFDAGVLRQCDAYVGLIGNRYGVPSGSSGPSFPELEYDAARRAGILRFVLVAPENLDVLAEEGEHQGVQGAFRRRIADQEEFERFDTPEEAADRVVAALLRWRQERAEEVAAGGAEKEPSTAAAEELWESILPAGIADQAARRDALGFRPYVRALAEFLTDPRTRPPLTLSVEGEWGSGKTSFMLQLREALAEARRGRGAGRRPPLTVWFNAWRHDQAREMWAAFAVEFARQVAAQRPLPRRWWGHLTLLRRRFEWRQGLPQLLRYLAWWLLVLGLAVAVPVVGFVKGPVWVSDLAEKLAEEEVWKNVIEIAASLGGVIGYGLLLLTLWLRLKSFLGSPVEFDLKQHLRSPDYQESLAFIERFHADFRHVVEAYAGSRTVYVFIDDVDRCDVPKAAELMEGLNLMMGSDLRLVTIVGMDREKVAAGLAVKHRELLPYLYEAGGRGGEDGAGRLPLDRLRGLEFGYEFIEKFIQLPFLVPQPQEGQLEGYMTAISGEASGAPAGTAPEREVDAGGRLRRWLARRRGAVGPPARQEPGPDRPGDGDADRAATASPGGPAPAGAQAAHREVMKIRASEDSATVRKIVLAVAPALGHNPRRLKQFLNLFRLRTYIAAETGLFDLPEGRPDKEALTLQQLGKFVALGLRWPLLLSEFARYPGLLATLQHRALGRDRPGAHPPFPYWTERQDLKAFLEVGCYAEDGEGDGGEGEAGKTAPENSAWSLAHVDVRRLLQVSPRVRTIERGTPEPAAPPSWAPAGREPVPQPAPPVAPAEPVAQGGEGAPVVPGAPEEPRADESSPAPGTAGGEPEPSPARPPQEPRTEARRPYDAYASYNSRDREEVLPILDSLSSHGVRVWSDVDLRPGDRWKQVMTEVLEQVPILLIFVGSSGPSSWQETERTTFLRKHSFASKRIVPVLLPSLTDTSHVPEALRDFQWVDFRQTDPDPLERLIQGIRQTSSVDEASRRFGPGGTGLS